MTDKYNIAIFGMNKYTDWQTNEHHNRCYHILKEILNRPEVDKVLYIDYLPIKRKDAARDYVKMLPNLLGRTTHKSPFSLCLELKSNKLYGYTTVLSVINWDEVYKDLKKVLNKLHFSNLILWSYYPLNVDFFDLIKEKITVFDIDSDWQKQKGLQHGRTIDYIEVLRKNYNSISNKSDFIFTSSDELLELFMGHDRSFWIPSPNTDPKIKTSWPEVVDEMFSIINSNQK